jgi:Ca2+-binding EF-hand superfamily protein
VCTLFNAISQSCTYICTLVANSNLNPLTDEELHEIFRWMDTNDNKWIEVKELKHMLEEIGLS